MFNLKRDEGSGLGGVGRLEEQPAMNPRGSGGEKMDLARRKEKGVSSDTTECSLLLLLLLPPGLRRRERRKNEEGRKEKRRRMALSSSASALLNVGVMFRAIEEGHS